jgi:hypothetical protein
MKALLLLLMPLWLFASCATPPDAPAQAAGLIVPADPAARAYLGLGGAPGSAFTLDQIKADKLVIDCFDLYCHVCQSQAHRLAGFERRLPAGTRIIGLGVGNTPMETSAFARKGGLTFPCFADRDNSIVRRFGKPNLPGFLVLRRDNGGFRQVYYGKGIPEDPLALVNSL